MHACWTGGKTGAMTQTIVLAGASGAIGRRLVPILKADGWRVVGLTRSPAKGDILAALGAEPVVADVFDAERLRAVVVAADPTVVLHQLTDLPPGLDPTRMEEATARNARIRDEGTRNLVAAALAAGVGRFVAQSIAFAYAEGPLPHREEDPLAVGAPGRAGVSARGVASLEDQILRAPLTGLVLRYGRIFGPGTGVDRPSAAPSVHVDAAAKAAALAATKGFAGLYNIAEDDSVVVSKKAKQQLGWVPDWRLPEARL